MVIVKQKAIDHLCCSNVICSSGYLIVWYMCGQRKWMRTKNVKSYKIKNPIAQKHRYFRHIRIAISISNSEFYILTRLNNSWNYFKMVILRIIRYEFISVIKCSDILYLTIFVCPSLQFVEEQSFKLCIKIHFVDPLFVQFNRSKIYDQNARG